MQGNRIHPSNTVRVPGDAILLNTSGFQLWVVGSTLCSTGVSQKLMKRMAIQQTVSNLLTVLE